MSSAPTIKPNARRCVLGVFRGVKLETNKSGKYEKRRVTVNIRCGRWDCPYCGPRKAKKAYKRALSGEMYQEAQASEGFRNYNFKLVTLTFGGSAKRALSSPKKAVAEMSTAFTKLIDALKHSRGDFHYLRVIEKHKDGWPHFHVLLCGENIASADVYTDIQKLWRYKYHLGFVHIRWKKEPKKAFNYCFKYLFKCLGYFPRMRLFQTSFQAFDRVKKEVAHWLDFEFLWNSCVAYLYEINPMCGLERVDELLEVLPVEGVPF